MSNKLVFLLLLSLVLGASWETTLSSGSLSGYLKTSEVSSFVTSLSSSSVSSSTLATTLNKQAIPVYHLTQPGTPYLGLSSKSSIIISAGHTTTQPLSVTMALYILGSLVSATSSDPNYSLYQFLMQSTNIYFVPMLNYDAYQNISDANSLSVWLKNFHVECA